MQEVSTNCKEGTSVKQLTIGDQQLIADFHQLTHDNQELLKAYMQGLLRAASVFGEEEMED